MAVSEAPADRRLIYRQSVWTRLTHWIWAVSLFFLLLSGLQIFNADPSLHIGEQTGFQFDNSVLAMEAFRVDGALVGRTRVLGAEFETTGLFGVSERNGSQEIRGFPAWATIPSHRDLGTGRVVHFFFAWVLVFTLVVWAVASLVNGHLWRDIVPKGRDLRSLPGDLINHLRFRLHHARDYNVMQKLSYFVVLVILLPLMILTGLTMSPNVNAGFTWMLDLFGGRQTARTIHFVTMLLLLAFFIIHILMVLLAGPLNELRSIITGWYRIDADEEE